MSLTSTLGDINREVQVQRKAGTPGILPKKKALHSLCIIGSRNFRAILECCITNSTLMIPNDSHTAHKQNTFTALQSSPESHFLIASSQKSIFHHLNQFWVPVKLLGKIYLKDNSWNTVSLPSMDL